MPEYMGVNFPLFTEKKTKKAKRDISSLETKAMHFWPPEAFPFACCWAVIEIVLLSSPNEVKIPYNKARDALIRLPGCQSLIREFKKFLPGASSWSTRMIVEGPNGKSTFKFLKMFREVYTRFASNIDCQEYFNHIREFLLIGFNSQKDRADHKYKVIPEMSKAGRLLCAIFIRTIAEACKIRLSDWNRYQSDEIDYIMNTKDPTTMPERDCVRLKRKEVRGIYDDLEWIFKHDGILLKGADQFYQCRIEPGDIEVYLDKLAKDAQKIDTSSFTPKQLKKFESKYYPNRSNIETAIAPFDEAIPGYRKWRK